MPAQTVNRSPILVESSGLISIVEAAVRKTYSLIPIPPNEKIDRIEDIRKIMRFFSDTQYYTFSNANNYRAKEL